MGFMDSLQNFVRIITGDDEEEEYYEDTRPVASAPRDIYATASTASTAPDYAAYYENLPAQQPAPEPESLGAEPCNYLEPQTYRCGAGAALDGLPERHDLYPRR